MKIVRTDSELQTPMVDKTLRDAGHELTLLPHNVSEADLILATQEADLVLMCYTPISRRVIDASPHLKGIVKYGVGIDAIDIPAAKDKGVLVVNIPEYAEETVAEGAFALMLALAKRIPVIERQMKSEGWAWPEPQWLGSDIGGKTIGIVGLGKIGRSMARMAGTGFGARVIAYDPYISGQHMAAIGIEKQDDLAIMLPQCDFVSIHCVLTPKTHHLIGESELRAMRPGSILINVSRGSIVDERALVKALNQGWIAGAGLDVYGQEPLTLQAHPMSGLFSHPNVILFPHLTFYTHEAMLRLEEETLERCFEILQNRPVMIKSSDVRLADQGGLAHYPY